MVAAWAQRIAKGRPLILAGDFNVKPGDAGYWVLTQGFLDPADAMHPAPTADAANCQLGTQEPLRSAYKLATGSEPDFTNWVRTRRDRCDFIACLDYVFVSSSVNVTGASPVLPSRINAPNPGPFPTAAEPSDHLMVAVDLLVPSDTGC